MCVVSMVGDHYKDKWKDWPSVFNPEPFLPSKPVFPFPNLVSKEEFEALKAEVEEMKKLLERAVEYDKRTNQPHCEMEDKVALLKKVAEYVGVDLSEIFGKEEPTNG
jgi:hypothetical protein